MKFSSFYFFSTVNRIWHPYLLSSSIALLISLQFTSFADEMPEVQKSNYKGWETLQLKNEWIDLQVCPAIGGRVIQLTMDEHPFFWVNKDLAGKQPPETGLASDGSWLNYGGEKIWPAPQGPDAGITWTGPPDPVLEGTPHHATIIQKGSLSSVIQLTSPKDSVTGVQFFREIQLSPKSSKVSIQATMTNISSNPIRWGIWSVAQMNAEHPNETGFNPELHLYAPINANSLYYRGYKVMFGLANNLQVSVLRQAPIVHVNYKYSVGKIGIDSNGGWVATVDGLSGYVFVERYTYHPERSYPDDSTVEVWMSGAGSGVAWGDPVTMPPNQPYLIESEILSPFAELSPGESYTYDYDWYACKIAGNDPVLDCTEAGIVCEALSVTQKDKKVSLFGKFGVFHSGRVELKLLDSQEEIVDTQQLGLCNPSTPLELNNVEIQSSTAVEAVLVLRVGQSDKELHLSKCVFTE